MKILFVGGHLDDEFSIINTLKEHMKKDDVYFLWLTLPRTFLTRKIRLMENSRAMEFLNVPQDHRIILKTTEKTSHVQAKKIYTKLKKFLNKFRPDIIYIPAFEGGNIDHDIAHVLTVYALRQLNLNSEIYEYPMYNSYYVKYSFLPYNYGMFLPNKIKIKKRALTKTEQRYTKSYLSNYLSQYICIRLYLYFFNKPKNIFKAEIIRPLPEYDYFIPPHEGVLGYEKYQGITFNDFIKGISFLENKKAKKPKYSTKPWYILYIKYLVNRI